jgi:hypothetical protein
VKVLVAADTLASGVPWTSFTICIYSLPHMLPFSCDPTGVLPRISELVSFLSSTLIHDRDSFLGRQSGVKLSCYRCRS